MAELADAHGSGPCESNLMEVQVLLSAPNTAKPTLCRGFCFVLHDFYTILCLSTLRKMQKAEPHKRLRLFSARFGPVSYILPARGCVLMYGSVIVNAPTVQTRAIFADYALEVRFRQSEAEDISVFVLFDAADYSAVDRLLN